MKSRTPYDKVELIQRSVRCFTWGIVGAIPGIGLPFAVVALGNYFSVARHRGAAWNPAEKYLSAGGAFAVIGVLLTMLLAAILVIEIS